ncbi:uncharacterized protein HKW66_Vig0245810 [Vigna angularis]|uniref:Uncharacterized protein n=1 Tax=Phaseolus angularis TaxID=3914 RepID=A0A8T0KEZ9_PHAAN|nr:uncharacterized protein HKW66_Vig0245810 [Vigna angularis]
MRRAFKIYLDLLKVLKLSTLEKEKEVSKSYEAVVKSSSNLAIQRKDAHSISISERPYDEENNNSTRKSMQCERETSRVIVNGGASTSNFDRDNVKEKFQVSFDLLEKYLEAHSKASKWENELLDVGY